MNLSFNPVQLQQTRMAFGAAEEKEPLKLPIDKYPTGKFNALPEGEPVITPDMLNRAQNPLAQRPYWLNPPRNPKPLPAVADQAALENWENEGGAVAKEQTVNLDNLREVGANADFTASPKEIVVPTGQGSVARMAHQAI